VDPDVEHPSDLHGLVYISLEGDWKIELARELGSAGIEVDMSRAT
jgi:predicted nucleotide-binding protein